MAELSDTQSDYNTVIKAIQHVELLKAEGLAAAQASSPLAAFANSQREFLQQRLRFLVESHVQTVTSVVGLEVRFVPHSHPQPPPPLIPTSAVPLAVGAGAVVG